MNRKELAILLSKLKDFESSKAKLEQYSTNSEIASDCLWNIYMKDGFEDKTVADLGCGPGILGLGALVLGASKAILIDVDPAAIETAKKNLELIEDKIGDKLNAEFVNGSVRDFKSKVDIIIENPPFGVQDTHADKAFLIKAMQCSKLIYSFHKIESENFVTKLAEDNGFNAKLYLRYKFPLKMTMRFHTKNVHSVDVGCFRLEKK